MCAVGDCLSVWYLRISLTQNMSECKEGDLGKVFLWQSLWLLNHLCKAKSEKEWQSFRCCAPYRWSKPDLWQLLGKQTKTKNCDLQPEILQIPFRIANALVLKGSDNCSAFYWLPSEVFCVLLWSSALQMTAPRGTHELSARIRMDVQACWHCAAPPVL